MSEICPDPRALTSCPFHQFSHQTGWTTDYFIVQWVHYSPTFCLSSQTALFLTVPLGLNFFTLLQTKSVLLGEAQSSRHNLTGMALVLGQRQLLSEWHTHFRRTALWKEGQLHQVPSACFSWHAASKLQQEWLAPLYSQWCRTQCNHPLSGGWAEEWSPYFLAVLAWNITLAWGHDEKCWKPVSHRTLLEAGERGSPIFLDLPVWSSFCLTMLAEKKEEVVLVQVPQILAVHTKF